MEKKQNPKSDIAAKNAYIQVLSATKKYSKVIITKAPADIIATDTNGINHFFEIKMTQNTTTYFGAATLTEWEAAMANPNTYKFVIAQGTSNNAFIFTEYTPAQFMQFSTIPPFKIYFNLNLQGATKKPKTRTARRLTATKLQRLLDFYKTL